MALDVKVKIDLTKPVRNLGLGMPLLLEVGATSEIKYTEVSELEGVVEAGFAEGTSMYSTAELLLAQDNAPETIAIAAVSGEDVVSALKSDDIASKDWRQLIVVGGKFQDSVAKYIETCEGKMYFTNIDLETITGAEAKALGNYNRTVAFCCNGEETEGAADTVAALVGETAGRTVGSFTYKNLKLKSIDVMDLSDTQINAIHKNGAITYVNKAGDNVTSEGKAVGGEYIDIIDSEDYIIKNLTYNVQKLLNDSDKLPYDNRGIAIVEAAVTDVMQNAFNSGIIAEDDEGNPDYSVTFKLREDTSASDRLERKYLGGSFKFALAGAIHTVEITGEITI